MADLSFPPSDINPATLRKLGEGRQAEVFAWSEAEVIKLFRGTDARASATHEAAAMLAAEASGVPMARLLGTATADGRPGILMEPLHGPDQLTLLGRQPWRLWSVGRTLGQLHAQLHSGPLGRGLPSLKEALQASIESSSLVPDDVQRAALAALEQLPDGEFVCHGDFHPGNVIETTDGPKVIDWSNAVRGDRHADLARTKVMFAGGDVGVNPPLLIRLLNHVGRRIVWQAYMRAYRRLRPFHQADLDAWIPVVAAQRLTEQIPGEREVLLQLARRFVPATPRRSSPS